MSFPITPTLVASMYSMLRECPPFAGWHLPEADAVEFKTAARKDIYGEHIEKTPPTRGARHTVTISVENNGHLDTILRSLAHEMIHVAQAVAKTANKNQHNADFHRRCRQVGRVTGWDPKAL